MADTGALDPLIQVWNGSIVGMAIKEVLKSSISDEPEKELNKFIDKIKDACNQLIQDINNKEHQNIIDAMEDATRKKKLLGFSETFSDYDYENLKKDSTLNDFFLGWQFKTKNFPISERDDHMMEFNTKIFITWVLIYSSRWRSENALDDDSMAIFSLWFEFMFFAELREESATKMLSGDAEQTTNLIKLMSYISLSEDEQKKEVDSILAKLKTITTGTHMSWMGKLYNIMVEDNDRIWNQIIDNTNIFGSEAKEQKGFLAKYGFDKPEAVSYLAYLSKVFHSHDQVLFKARDAERKMQEEAAAAAVKEEEEEEKEDEAAIASAAAKPQQSLDSSVDEASKKKEEEEKTADVPDDVKSCMKIISTEGEITKFHAILGKSPAGTVVVTRYTPNGAIYYRLWFVTPTSNRRPTQYALVSYSFEITKREDDDYRYALLRTRTIKKQSFEDLLRQVRQLTRAKYAESAGSKPDLSLEVFDADVYKAHLLETKGKVMFGTDVVKVDTLVDYLKNSEGYKRPSLFLMPFFTAQLSVFDSIKQRLMNAYQASDKKQCYFMAFFDPTTDFDSPIVYPHDNVTVVTMERTRTNQIEFKKFELHETQDSLMINNKKKLHDLRGMDGLGVVDRIIHYMKDNYDSLPIPSDKGQRKNVVKDMEDSLVYGVDERDVFNMIVQQKIEQQFITLPLADPKRFYVYYGEIEKRSKNDSKMVVIRCELELSSVNDPISRVTVIGQARLERYNNEIVVDAYAEADTDADAYVLPSERQQTLAIKDRLYDALNTYRYPGEARRSGPTPASRSEDDWNSVLLEIEQTYRSMSEPDMVNEYFKKFAQLHDVGLYVYSIRRLKKEEQIKAAFPSAGEAVASIRGDVIPMAKDEFRKAFLNYRKALEAEVRSNFGL